MTSATARRIEATAAGALERSGRPGSALTAASMATTGSAPVKAGAADRGVTAAIGMSRPSRAAAKKLDRTDEIERRHVQFGASAPNVERKVGADPGRLAERQCQWLHDRSSSGLDPKEPCIRSWPSAAIAQGNAWIARRTSFQIAPRALPSCPA